MSATALRIQLFGLSLVLVGGLHDLVEVTQGYGLDDPSLGAILVTLEVLTVLVGLVGPALWPSNAGDT